MNFLKKTLGKEQTKKQTQKMPSSFLKKHQTVDMWNNNIDQLLQKRAHKKQETSFDRSINKIVDQKIKQPKNLTEEEYQSVIELFVDVYKRHDKVGKVEKANVKWSVCGDLVKRLKSKVEDISKSIEYLEVSKFIHELEIEMMINERDEKRKKIEEFETMVSFKSYKPKVEEKEKQKQKQRQKQVPYKLLKWGEKPKQKNTSFNKSQSQSKKKIHNKSAKNLSSSSLKRLNDNLQRKKSQGDIQFSKLQNLLKDVSTKVVRGNIEYDYSSILEGSKSNIQCRKGRNMTQKEEPKAIEKKVKKNQAFVFYRPGRG